VSRFLSRFSILIETIEINQDNHAFLRSSRFLSRLFEKKIEFPALFAHFETILKHKMKTNKVGN
jgi:hypothetical protein